MMYPIKHMALLLLISTQLFWGGATLAQDNAQEATDRLEKIEAEIKDRNEKEAALRDAAAKAAEDAALTSKNLIALAATIQQKEEDSTRLEKTIRRLEEEEIEKTKSLEAQQQDLVELLAVLERLSNRPAALALMQPSKALDTVHTANLLSTLVPEIEKKAANLKVELNQVKDIRAQLSAQRTELNEALEETISARSAMTAILQHQRNTAKKATQEADLHAQTIKKLGEEAQSMKDLIAKITAASNRRPPSKANTTLRASLNFQGAKGTLSTPVKGIVSERFGKKLSVGTSKGLRFTTRQNAQVIAPYHGEVVFADNFRDFGLVIIIAHGNGYHSLIAGLEESYPRVGDWLQQGEPIGIMANIENGGPNNKNPSLYVEIRHNNIPVNPMPWFRQ